MTIARYRLVDEIEPVKEGSWAFTPEAPILAAAFLKVFWFEAFVAGNSWLLGHPRRRDHTLAAAGCAVGTLVVLLLVLPLFPEGARKYVTLLITAFRLTLAYWLTWEQDWVADHFAAAGGRVIGVSQTIMILLVLDAILETLHLGWW